MGDSHGMGIQKECLTKTLPFFKPLNIFWKLHFSNLYGFK
jgi:hypothetical protein